MKANGATIPETEILTSLAALEAFRPEWEALLARSGCNEPTMAPPWVLGWWRVFGGQDGRALRALRGLDGRK